MRYIKQVGNYNPDIHGTFLNDRLSIPDDTKKIHNLMAAVVEVAVDDLIKLSPDEHEFRRVAYWVRSGGDPEHVFSLRSICTYMNFELEAAQEKIYKAVQEGVKKRTREKNEPALEMLQETPVSETYGPFIWKQDVWEKMGRLYEPVARVELPILAIRGSEEEYMLITYFTRKFRKAAKEKKQLKPNGKSNALITTGSLEESIEEHIKKYVQLRTKAKNISERTPSWIEQAREIILAYGKDY